MILNLDVKLILRLEFYLFVGTKILQVQIPAVKCPVYIITTRIREDGAIRL